MHWPWQLLQEGIMATAIRIDDKLVREASAEAQLQRRSTPKQIEYWAEIGRIVAGEVSAEDLISIAQGNRRVRVEPLVPEDRKSTRLNSSHVKISYAVFCLKKKSTRPIAPTATTR